MHWANYVYKFAPWKDLGCWKDKINDRAVPYLLVNYRGHIDWLNIGRISKSIVRCRQRKLETSLT